MARMIPPVFDRDRTPPGEQMVFEALRGDPLTKDWTVLHAYDLPRHVSQIEGEIDFVVIVPHSGVVILEVKSHTSVRRRDDGMWCLGTDSPSSRSPFKQASAAAHSLLRDIQRVNPTLQSTPFIPIVCFPRCSFEVPPTEWESWQVIDEPALTRATLAVNILGSLHRARERFANAGQKWLTTGSPDSEQVKALLRTLRPRFEVFQSPGARARELTTDLLQFTEEQYESLDIFELNDRVMLLGGAGTGKTLLAIKQARRFAATGARVLLLCFNRNLRTWMNEQLEGSDLPIDVQTIHSLLLDIAGTDVPSSPDQHFWDQILPDNALETLFETGTSEPKYTALVMDEAQDVLFDPFLDVLDLLVEDGLDGAPLAIFADFEWQTIYPHVGSDPKQVADLRLPNITKYPLRTNCRNVPRIGTFVTSTVRDRHLYKSYRRPDNGFDHDLLFYGSRADQVSLLEQVLRRYRQEGFQNHEIAVLSFWSDERSAAAELPEEWRSRLAPLRQSRPGQGRYCSIAGFKGLDAPAVVLTDIETMTRDWERFLLYIGASRATDRLVLLINRSTADDLAKMIT